MVFKIPIMLIYNVTVNIDEDVEVKWKKWMKETHIPAVLATGRFTGSKFLRLLNESPDATGITYAIQYYAENIGQLEAYLDHEAPALRKSHNEAFPSKFAAFRTVLEEVD